MKLKALALFVASLISFAPAWAVPTTLTVQQSPSVYSTIAADGADVTMTAGDASNGNDFVSSGDEIVIVQNTHATLAYTVTFTSVADSLNRTGDITAYSLAAGDIAVFGPFPAHGWRYTGNKIRVTVSNASVKIGLKRLPTNR